MTKTTYARPSKTKATAIGQHRRSLWARTLRKKAYEILPTVEVMAAEQSVANTIRSRKGQDRAAWTSIRTRFDQVALLDLLRKRHLKATGKEISRSEALAALMAAGLKQTLGHAEFGGSA